VEEAERQALEAIAEVRVASSILLLLCLSPTALFVSSPSLLPCLFLAY
jgi:hypothetical protein